MKKLFLFLVLLVAVPGWAQPTIANPTPYEVCAFIPSYGVFDLSTKNAEITLGQPNLMVAYYYGSNYTQAIVNPTAFINTMSPQTIWVRVTDPNDGTFSDTTLTLIVNDLPTSGHSGVLTFVDQPFDGVVTFNLEDQNSTILNGQTGMFVEYYLTYMDAVNQTNAISGNFTNFSNPQTIWYRVVNATTQCSFVNSIQIQVTNPGIIYIPDANLKTAILYNGAAKDVFGNTLSPDTNGNGELEYTEATAITQIYIESMGIQSGVGLREIASLQKLYCSYNQIPVLDFNGLQNLYDLRCEGNGMTTLNVTNCPALSTLFCGNNAITALDLSGKPNLTTVWCEVNQIPFLDVSESTQLLDLSCRNNNLNALDLTQNTALTNLNCGSNYFTTLDVSQCVNLIHFHCASEPITSLDLSGLTALTDLNLRYCNLTSIDLSDQVNLTSFYCDGNLYNSLDLSNNPNLTNLYCSNAVDLNNLNLKNGTPLDWNNSSINFNAALHFICVDNNELNAANVYFVQSNQSVVVNSFCSITPGGSYNTITGTIRYDSDTNGCDANDYTASNVHMLISDGTNSGGNFSTYDGDYSFYTSTGNFTITPILENPSWYIIDPPTATFVFNNTNNNQIIQDFCLTPVGNHQDLEIVVSPVDVPRPGFPCTFKIVYRNKGNQIVSQVSGIQFIYNPNQIVYSLSSNTPTSTTANSLNWDYTSLYPTESRTIWVTFIVNSPTNSNPVNIGDSLEVSTQIGGPVAVDEQPDDNYFTLTQTVVGSYDPNDIICLEGGSLSPSRIGDYLHHRIRFENTGTYLAEKVVIEETIDPAQFNINSLQLLEASNPCYIALENNLLRVYFDQINLAAAAGNPPVGGHGDILFKIRSQSNLIPGDSVDREVNIYFDYNAPIQTNQAETVFSGLNNGVITPDTSLQIYPNPARDILHLEADSKLLSIEWYDVQGRLLQNTQLQNTVFDLNLSRYSKGIYFLKITTEKGQKVEKIIKE